jgi:hypothetical protein
VKRLRLAVLLAVLLCLPGAADGAVTLRYGIVVGNNSSPGNRLPKLAHAEAEAQRLAVALRRYAGFDQERLILLTSPSRAELMMAADRLFELKRQDLEQWPGATTVFGFFFTGHGQEGQLLMADGPVDREALGRIFERAKASFSLGFFDACFSGSLSTAQGKGGIKPKRVGDLFRGLPEHVLTAEGTMWFTSSGADELSFEDSTLGGVFTHFFIEGLRRAERDGPAISIDRLWRYARDKTVRYTTDRHQPQKPRMLARLSGEVFPYISFPVPRTSELRLGAEVEGSFALSWAAGSLTQLLNKHRGTPMSVRVFPGEARLVRLAGGKQVSERRLDFGRHPITISRGDEAPPLQPVGYANRGLWRKGGYDGLLEATVSAPSSTLNVGVSYGFAPSLGDDLGAQHIPALALRLDRGAFAAELDLGYGYGAQTFDAWDYTVYAFVPALRLGWARDVGTVRLTVGSELGAMVMWQRFGDGARREPWSARAGGAVSVLWPNSGRVKGVVSLRGGLRFAPDIADDSDPGVGGWLGVSVGALLGVP